MRKIICDKCGEEIKGIEKLGKIKKEKVLIRPWRVEITTKHWKGYVFELCNDCRKALVKSLKYKAETYDC